MIYLLLFNIINCFLLFSFGKIITYQRCVSVYNGSFIANGPEKGHMRFITFKDAISDSFISAIFAIRENDKCTESECKKEKRNRRLNVTEHLWGGMLYPV